MAKVRHQTAQVENMLFVLSLRWLPFRYLDNNFSSYIFT